MEIESKLGRQAYSGGSSDRRVFTIPNEDQQFQGSIQQPPRRRDSEGLDEEQIKELESARKMKMDRENRISPEARTRIEFLSGIGRLEESVKVENTKFTLQSLKAYEQEEVFDCISNLGDVTAVKMQFEIRAQTLARAIYAIDDQPLGIVVGSNHIEDKVAAMRELDENVADYLYKWYQENIVKKAQSKYSVKNEEEAKEVVEAVKK